MQTLPIETGLSAWWHPASGGALPCRVLVVHGLGEHSERHRNTIDYLVSQGVEIVRFDLRGCGRSPGRRQWIDRWDDYLDDVAAVRRAIEKLPALPLFLYGHSLGGSIALHHAARAQAGLKGLLLSSPGYLPGGGVSPLKIKVGRMLARFAPGLKIPGSLDLGNLSRDPGVVEAYRQDPLCDTFNTVRQGNEILSALEEIPQVCRRISVPTLILHGGADRIIRPEGSEVILKELACSDKRLEVLPGGYHELYNDLDKEAFFTLVRNFLARQLAG